MMKVFGMCFNPKVLAGLAVIGVGTFVFISPGAALRALPILIGLACPLSMLLMVGGMGAMMKHNSLSQPPQPIPGRLSDREIEVKALRERLEVLEASSGRG